MGLLKTLFLSQFKLPRDVHRFAFKKHGAKTALQFKSGAVSYAALQTRAYRLVQVLKTVLSQSFSEIE